MSDLYIRDIYIRSLVLTIFNLTCSLYLKVACIRENTVDRIFMWNVKMNCLSSISILHYFKIRLPICKIKVVPYTFVCGGVPVREDTYPEQSACEVGWPVPFLTAFISPVLPPRTHVLLGEK